MWTGQQHCFRPRPRPRQDCPQPTNTSVLSDDVQKLNGKGREAWRSHDIGKQELNLPDLCLVNSILPQDPNGASPLLEISHWSSSTNTLYRLAKVSSNFDYSANHTTVFFKICFVSETSLLPSK